MRIRSKAHVLNPLGKGREPRGKPADRLPMAYAGAPPPVPPPFPRRLALILIFLIMIWGIEVILLHTHGLLLGVTMAALVFFSMLEKTHVVTECLAQLLEWFGLKALSYVYRTVSVMLEWSKTLRSFGEIIKAMMDKFLK